MNPVQKEKLEKMNVMLNATLTNLVGVMNEVRTAIALNNDIMANAVTEPVSAPAPEKAEPVSLPMSKLPSLLESIVAPAPAALTAVHSMPKLFSPESPLLDLFAASHFFPKGRGSVYPGHPDFKWVRTIEVSEENASRLPSGFYGDTINHIVIRLENFILLLKVQSGVDTMSKPHNVLVFIANVSEATPDGGTEKWFPAFALPVTPAKKLVDELEKLVAVYKAA